jgi:acyl-CoA synthetase (AMP-forming)/AMP-acid ligase II
MRLTHGLHRGLRQYPDEPATIDALGVRTWRESADRVARLAGGFRGLGLSQGDRIAILALNSSAYHECELAVAWAGAVFVPLNTRWSVPEIDFALRDSGTRMLLVDDTFLPVAEKLRAEGSCPETVLHIAPESTVYEATETLIMDSDLVDDADRGGEDLAGIYYTGGTTGRPKLVI